MADNDKWFSIEPTLETQSTWRFVHELEKRYQAVQRMFPYVAAMELREMVLHRLPKSKRLKEYRDSLDVFQVSGGPMSFAVFSPLKARGVRKIDTGRTVVYVRVKPVRARKHGRELQALKILEEQGPWTPETIPFWPSKDQAVIVQRRVSKREASKIAKLQEAQRGKIETQLAAIGFRGKKLNRKSKKFRGKAVSDVALIAIDTEFGNENTRPIPAWRVSLSELLSQRMKKVHEKYKQLGEAMFTPDTADWHRWPGVVKRISLNSVSGFVPFMKRLGYG